MADRQQHSRGGRGGGGHRGGAGGHRGGGRGGGNRDNHRGGGHGHQHQSGGGGDDGNSNNNNNKAERPRKENILDLSKYMDKKVNVKFNGGRECSGTLKGYDALMNLVLDDVEEVMRDDEGNEVSRPLGLVVVRGTLLVLLSPVDGSEVIENPFAVKEDE